MDLRRPRDLPAIVRGTRTDLGLSQDELARRAGVARKTVNEIERGASDPRLSIMLAVLDALDVSVTVRPNGASRPITPPGTEGTNVDLDHHLSEYDDG